jgi:seryl-tRNA synthetase
VPPGKDETENLVIRKWGEPKKFDFEIKDHVELGKNLDLIDIERAAKISGSRFYYLKNEAVILEFALVMFAIDILTKKGFIPIIPPVLAKEEIFVGMGYLPQADLEMYKTTLDEFRLAATSEQTIGPMFKDEILREEDLPLRYVGFSSCFRREAGSYGKDVRGILRVHQFDKVEMFIFCKKEESQKEHELILSCEEEIMQKLSIPYQVVMMCTGDLGFPVAKKYDIEAWIPSENKYRETHSTSNCTDFQARRLNIRYRKKDKNIEFVHTLNGTAIAIGRTLIAIFENYQQKDGSIIVPEVLRKYAKIEIIKR